MKKIITTTIIAAIITLATITAQAAGSNTKSVVWGGEGNDRDFLMALDYDNRNAAPVYTRGYALGMIHGIASELNINETACIPATVNGIQLTKVVKKYIDDNPHQMDWQIASLISLSLMKAFPCK